MQGEIARIRQGEARLIASLSDLLSIAPSQVDAYVERHTPAGDLSAPERIPHSGQGSMSSASPGRESADAGGGHRQKQVVPRYISGLGAAGVGQGIRLSGKPRSAERGSRTKGGGGGLEVGIAASPILTNSIATRGLGKKGGAGGKRAAWPDQPVPSNHGDRTESPASFKGLMWSSGGDLEPMGGGVPVVLESDSDDEGARTVLPSILKQRAGVSRSSGIVGAGRGGGMGSGGAAAARQIARKQVSSLDPYRAAAAPNRSVSR